jgi:hypothetical protein
MNTGEKIGYVVNRIEINEITNLVPVKYCDDGSNQWYEVVEPTETDLVALIGKDIAGNESIVIINRNSENLGLLLDLF